MFMSTFMLNHISRLRYIAHTYKLYIGCVQGHHVQLRAAAWRQTFARSSKHRNSNAMYRMQLFLRMIMRAAVPNVRMSSQHSVPCDISW